MYPEKPSGSNSASAKMSATALASAMMSWTSMDDEEDHDGVGDLPTRGVDLAMASRPGTSGGKRTTSAGGERTTGAGGVSVVAEGD
jgi:hypothetical protein